MDDARKQSEKEQRRLINKKAYEKRKQVPQKSHQELCDDIIGIMDKLDTDEVNHYAYAFRDMKIRIKKIKTQKSLSDLIGITLDEKQALLQVPDHISTRFQKDIVDVCEKIAEVRKNIEGAHNVYILLCENNKYYVGISDTLNPDLKNINSHWVYDNKPLRTIANFNGVDQDVNIITSYIAKIVSYDNVRGGTSSNLGTYVLSKYDGFEKNQLLDILMNG